MTATARTLPADAASVAVARAFIRETLAEWGADGASETAAILVSEVATNAVLHARTAFTVEVSRIDGIIRICVVDGSPAQAKIRGYGLEATTGRGLRLVASMASRWGMEQQDDGKRIWFEISVDSGGAGEVHTAPTHIDTLTLLADFPDDLDGPTAHLSQDVLPLAA